MRYIEKRSSVVTNQEKIRYFNFLWSLFWRVIVCCGRNRNHEPENQRGKVRWRVHGVLGAICLLDVELWLEIKQRKPILGISTQSTDEKLNDVWGLLSLPVSISNVCLGVIGVFVGITISDEDLITISFIQDPTDVHCKLIIQLKFCLKKFSKISVKKCFLLRANETGANITKNLFSI